MSAAAPEPATARPRPLRRRIVEAALDLTSEVGWPAVTMGKLAGVVGVSRQTVYNEVGSRNGLVEAMVAHELTRFLAVVEDAFDAHPDDVRAAIQAATSGVLRFADGHPLVRALLAPAGGAESDVLPLLTTRSAGLLAVASDVVATRVRTFAPTMDESTLLRGCEASVRLVLSYLVQPGTDVDSDAETITWVAVRLLRLPVSA